MSARTTLSVAIMSHPTRAASARRQSEALGGVPIVVDYEERGPLSNSLRAWARADPSATHHLVLQDDVVFAPDLLAQFARAAAEHPRAILAGYAHWHSKNGAAARLGAVVGASWAEAVQDSCFPTQAAAVPTAYLDEYIAYAMRFESMILHDDFPLARFMQERAIPGLIATPALVQHQRLPNTTGNPSPTPLQAACFVPGELPRHHESVAEGYEICPLIWDGRADLLVRTIVNGQLRWTTSHWAHYASTFALEADRPRRHFDKAMKRSPALRILAGVIPAEYLCTVWTVSYLLGTMVARELVPVSARAGASEVDAAAAAALRTLAIGGLRNVRIRFEDIEDNTDSLHAMALEAHHLGRGG